MPIPKPKNGESSKDFIPRCMSALSDENKPQDVKLGICYSTYRNAKKNSLINTSLKLFKSLLNRFYNDN